MDCKEKKGGVWTFAAMGDLHIGSPRSYRFNPTGPENWCQAKKQLETLQPDFLLICGDMTRDGVDHPEEMEMFKKEIKTLSFPCHVIPGNVEIGNKHAVSDGGWRGDDDGSGRMSDVEMNCTRDALDRYRQVFGAPWWSFEQAGVRFSGITDIIFGTGFPEEEEQWRWMEKLAEQPALSNHVWIMHHPLFIHSINEKNYDITNPEEYLHWYFGLDNPYRQRFFEILKTSGAGLVLSGHVHNRIQREAEGIRFHALAQNYNKSQFFGETQWPDGSGEPGFMIYTVEGMKISGRFQPLEVKSVATGFGPAGHLRLSRRDYSVSWEKPALRSGL